MTPSIKEALAWAEGNEWIGCGSCYQHGKVLAAALRSCQEELSKFRGFNNYEATTERAERAEAHLALSAAVVEAAKMIGASHNPFSADAKRRNNLAAALAKIEKMGARIPLDRKEYISDLEAHIEKMRDVIENECSCGYCDEHQQRACTGCKCGYQERRKAALTKPEHQEKL